MEAPAEAPVDADLARMVQCQSVVERYRPAAGGAIKEVFRREYLDTCLRSATEMPTNRIGQLRTVLARLSLDGAGLCTVATLAPRLAVVARHCLLGSVDALGASISSATLDRVEIAGMNASGTAWKVTGVRVIADPFVPGTPLYAGATEMRRKAPKLLDFVIVAPKSRDSRFGEDREPSATIEANAAPALRARLILSSILSNDLQPRTDDFLSCQVSGSETGYFRHHCQALPGSSGAPIFVATGDGALKIIGLHIGREGAIGPKNKQTENEAVLLPDFLVDEIAARLGVS